MWSVAFWVWQSTLEGGASFSTKGTHLLRSCATHWLAGELGLQGGWYTARGSRLLQLKRSSQDKHVIILTSLRHSGSWLFFALCNLKKSELLWKRIRVLSQTEAQYREVSMTFKLLSVHVSALWRGHFVFMKACKHRTGLKW